MTPRLAFKGPPMVPVEYEPPKWNPPSFNPPPIVTRDDEKPRMWSKTNKHNGNCKTKGKA